MWKFYDYNYFKIRELILDKMDASPNAKAILAFQMLATARIMEILPNPRYKFALKFNDIIIHDGFFHLPLVEKKIGFSQKSKKRRKIKVEDLDKISAKELVEMTKGRNSIIWDKDLWEVFMDYVTNQRPNWKGELLEKTTLNPNKYDIFLAKSMSGRLSPKKKWVKERMATYKKYSFLFEPYREGRYIDYVIFPFNYVTYYKEISKYFVGGTLFDVGKSITKKGSRKLYTHFAREASVNILYEIFGLNLDEISILLAFDKKETVMRYFRPNIRKLLKARDIIKDIWEDKNPYLEDKKEINLQDFVKIRAFKNENIKKVI